MKFILGAVLGGAVGYVLGAQAGRERYDQIVASVSDMVGQDVVKQITDMLDQGASEMRKAASETADAASDLADDAMGGDGSGS